MLELTFSPSGAVARGFEWHWLLRVLAPGDLSMFRCDCSATAITIMAIAQQAASRSSPGASGRCRVTAPRRSPATNAIGPPSAPNAIAAAGRLTMGRRPKSNVVAIWAHMISSHGGGRRT